MSRRRLGAIRERSPGVFRVELTAGFDPITGKVRRFSETVHGSDIDAERALARMLLDVGRMPAGRHLSVREFIDDLYKPWLEDRVRKMTRLGYESKLDKHVLPKLGDVVLGELEPYVLDRWRDGLLSKMSGRSALHVYRVFSAALNRAVKWRLIPVNPLAAVDPPRAGVRDLETLSADEALGYLEAFKGHVLEPIVVVALGTGLRPCELAALSWSDIDLAEAEVKVSRGLHERKGEVWIEAPKSDRSHRTVSLPEWCVVLLRPLRALGPLAPHSGTHMPPTMISRLYRAQVASKSLRYVPIRDLRHTHATLLLEAGVDLVVVSRRLGHSTIAITDAHYLRPKRSSDQAAAAALGVLFQSRAKPEAAES